MLQTFPVDLLPCHQLLSAQDAISDEKKALPSENEKGKGTSTKNMTDLVQTGHSSKVKTMYKNQDGMQ